MTKAPSTRDDATPAEPAETAGFPIEFERPGDEQLSWEWDDMHMPFAMTTLAGDYVRELITGGMNEHYRMFDFPQRMRCAVWHGYVYFGMQRTYPIEERPAVLARYVEVSRQRAEITSPLWWDEVIPELHHLYDSIAAVDVDGLGRSELGDGWDAAWNAGLRAWELHFIWIMGPYQILEDLTDLYTEVMGKGTDQEALRLIHGKNDDLASVDFDIERLAMLATGHPAVAARLQQPGGADVEMLGSLPGGPEFAAALEEFLDRHGHLGQGFDDLALASWAEDPRLILRELGKRIARPAASAERRARLIGESDELAARVREHLADKPEELERFEHVLEVARAIGPLTEGHNYWIDRMAQARLRTLAVRVGRRLAREGLLEAPDDIFHLHVGEIAATLRDAIDRRSLVLERRREHQHNRSLTPPRNLGKPPIDTGPVDRFDSAPIESTEADVLRGTGASAGIARGPARVALGPDDFGRIQPGDIIVCPSSNPSWVPVFTIAAGLVTNTGGVLSHAAVVAREFGLPAVVGARDATTSIADGRLLEIDGTLGTVRLL
ncbi:MAG TPA: PEP-utilizing enzyme [Candidatus Eisenbacteria bacterium]|nr:PEP-utilizing enzyme [Candidatus Eisenbacteria bacterium]